FAEYEREKIRERCTRSLITKAREGFIPSGRPPYGYKLSDKGRNKKAPLLVKEDEARVVRLIFQLYAHEGLSLREVSRKLKELGIKAPEGGDWDNRTMRNILARETYVGTYHFRKKVATEPKRPTKKLRKARSGTLTRTS
ncbi:MAG: recombinase family protein, partial [Candidatus Hydrothermia bacterium]